MEAYEAIVTRRSIRKYDSRAVSEKTVEELLNAAMHAPSGGDKQPWHFVVITDRIIIDEIPKFHHYCGMLKEAQLAILVCGDLRASLMNNVGYLIQDCSAATQNLLLAAHAKGLGAVWLGVYPRPERISGMKNLLGIPDHIIPLALISIGYPAETNPKPARFDSSKIHKNKW